MCLSAHNRAFQYTMQTHFAQKRKCKMTKQTDKQMAKKDLGSVLMVKKCENMLSKWAKMVRVKKEAVVAHRLGLSNVSQSTVDAHRPYDHHGTS